MPTHKVTTIVQNSIKGPSALKTTFHDPKDYQKLKKSTAITPEAVPDTVAYILKKSNGDLEKASKLLDQKLTATNQTIHELTENRSQLTDEQFYERLTALKEQHKNTVAMCQDLYSLTHREEEKLAAEQPQKSVKFMDDQPTDRQSDFIRASLAELERRVTLDESHAAKPPLPRREGRRLTSSAAVHQSRSLSASSDEQHWPAKESDDEELEGGENEDDQLALRQRYQELLRSKVKAMWSDVRPRSGSLDRSWSRAERVDSSHDQMNQQENWRHRVTVPEPFNMTLREESQAEKKSRSMILFEENEKKRQEAEEAECRFRFKANPVPANVFLPLFDELQEDRENRRREIKQHSQELLKSQERPFSFAKRDEERKRQQKSRLSEADKQKSVLRSTKGDRKDAVIRARPVPASVHASRTRRMQEDEVFRQIKVRMRAEETLRQSAAPGEMMERQRAMEQKRASRLAKYERPSRRQRPHSADGRPRVGRNAPDFDRLHRTFQLELLERRADVRVTRPSPFKLRTEKRGQKIQEKTEEHLQRQKDPKSFKILRDFSQRYPSDERSVRTIGRYEDAPPARLTHSAQLREVQRNAERRVEEQRRKEVDSQELQRQLRRRQLAQSLRASTSEIDATLGPTIQERTRSRQEAQRDLDEDYKQKLRELNQKVKERDLLVVQQAKLIAQQKARARYRQTLLDAGVDPSKVDEMAKNYHETDAAAYAEEESLPPEDDGDNNEQCVEEQLDQTRFGSPSPVHE